MEHIFTSQVLDMDRAYSVYLPQSYDRDPDKYYPVLYLLHGANDNNLCWENKASLSSIQNLLVAVFVEAMRTAGIPFQFRVRDGGHTWGYCYSGLYMLLPFVSNHFVE